MDALLKRGVLSSRTHFKALGDGEGDGTFEAIVAVFGNVDHQNDRIIPGAFSETIREWKQSGDPIPVVYTHKWTDLAAFVGEILDAEELLPGSPKLPKGLQPFGGLWVKGRLDIDEDLDARKLFRLLKRRRIKEWSFAYDVLDERPGEDGANELIRLSLIEIGPTLKGANSLTTTVATKAAPPAAGRKAEANVAGSFEDRQRAVSDAVHADLLERYPGEPDEVYSWIDATFDDRVVVSVRDWRPDVTERRFFLEYDYTISDDGTVTLAEPRPVEIVGTVVGKSHTHPSKEGRRNSTSDTQRIQTVHDTVVELGALCAGEATEPKTAEPPAKSQEPETAKDDEPRRIDPLAAQISVLELTL